jgi:Family of unknown function (DUF6502)
MARKKRPVKQGRSARRSAMPRLSPAEIAPMALELYSAVGAALLRYGLSAKDLKQAFEGSRRPVSGASASAQHLNQIRPVGDLMTAWLEELPYIDDSNKPRVLDIKGRGATFESLAKRFLPGRPVAEVVELAARFANVGVLAGGKIALYGDTMVNLSKMPQSVLAQTILHVKQIIDTCLYNAQIAGSGRMGRTERIVAQAVSPEEFEKFNRVMRPQLHDLCERVDRLLNSNNGRKSRKRGDSGAAGIGVYVYYNGSVKRARSESREVGSE